MKLIVIYGPPAAGKLTVARELAARTGYKLLHNHQTFDQLEPVFGAYHPEFNPLLARLRTEIITTAARAGLDGVILTQVYGPEDTPFMHGLRDAVESRGGRAHFIRLTADIAELERRVQHEKRHEFKKIRTPAELRALMHDWDVSQAVPGVQSLVIDSTNLGPGDVVEMILGDILKV